METLNPKWITEEGVLVCVVGARPNFMKIAPVMHALAKRLPDLPVMLVHTGQHYDGQMKDTFFNQLDIPEPDVDLGVGSGTHAAQTAEIMRRFEPVVDRVRAVAILVVGDVNSTIACALVAAKKGIPVIHVEAGLRSRDRGMPEEINRILTDQLSDILFTTEASARENLLREGIEEYKIHFVGNVMIDTLRNHLAKAVPAIATIAKYKDRTVAESCSRGFAVLTLHRPSNVDDPVILDRLMDTIRRVGECVPVVFPVHPRTRQVLERSGLVQKLHHQAGIVLLPPVAYLEMLGFMAAARFVLTDSGGVQEETTALGIPCVTLRENTERPITVEQGTNVVVGRNPERILDAVQNILTTGGKAGRIPELWDGGASDRICSVLLEWLERRQRKTAVAV